MIETCVIGMSENQMSCVWLSQYVYINMLSFSGTRAALET